LLRNKPRSFVAKTLTRNADHLVHHLLALWALGARPEQIQDMWDYNQAYQTPIDGGKPAESQHRGKDLNDPTVYKECLENNSCYGDYLKFFEEKIAEIGVTATLKEYLLKRDKVTDSVFYRMYSGKFSQHQHFLSPISSSLWTIPS
jgi:oxidoreductase AflY